MLFDKKVSESELLIFKDTLGIVKDGEVGVDRGKRGDLFQVSGIVTLEQSKKGKERPLRPEEGK